MGHSGPIYLPIKYWNFAKSPFNRKTATTTKTTSDEGTTTTTSTTTQTRSDEETTNVMEIDMYAKKIYIIKGFFYGKKLFLDMEEFINCQRY